MFIGEYFFSSILIRFCQVGKDEKSFSCTSFFEGLKSYGHNVYQEKKKVMVTITIKKKKKNTKVMVTMVHVSQISLNLGI